MLLEDEDCDGIISNLVDGCMSNKFHGNDQVASKSKNGRKRKKRGSSSRPTHQLRNENTMVHP
jgi:hypothetical protein